MNFAEAKANIEQRLENVFAKWEPPSDVSIRIAREAGALLVIAAELVLENENLKDQNENLKAHLDELEVAIRGDE